MHKDTLLYEINYRLLLWFRNVEKFLDYKNESLNCDSFDINFKLNQQTHSIYMFFHNFYI